MKNYTGSILCFLITVLVGNAQPANPEEMIEEVKMESYAVTGGEDTRYMATIGPKGFMTWDSQEDVISQGSWATDCFACKVQVLNDHLIMLKNHTKEKKAYAYIYGVNGEYLGSKELLENKRSYYFPYAQTSLNGSFALYEAQQFKNGFFDPSGYIGINSNAELLWSIDIKTFEKEYGAVIKSYQIDNEGNGVFLLLKEDKENHVFTMVRIPAGGGSPQRKIIKIARQKTEVSRVGMTMHPDGRVLMYANYFNRMYNQELKHGFVYGVVDFGTEEVTTLRQVQRNWTRKLEYWPNHLQGIFSGNDFYFANEVMFKVVGPGNDDIFYILNKVDDNGNILNELKIPCAIAFAESSRVSYMAELNDGNLMVAYTRRGEKGETNFVSEYKIVDRTFKELKGAIIEQRSGFVADTYNQQIRIIDKYALIVQPRLDYIWLLLNTEK